MSFHQPGDHASLSEENDLPLLPPAADIRSRLISSERGHNPDSIVKQDSSVESHRETESQTSSLNNASASGLDSDAESNVSHDSAPSSPQTFATSPEELSDVVEGLDSAETSSLGAVEASNIIPDVTDSK